MKKISIQMLAAAMALMLTACGSGEKPEQEIPRQDSIPETTEDSSGTAERAEQEADDNVRPEFTLDANPEEYDVIFVGYPIWHYQMPMVMQTFFDTYNFSGKTILPFNTHLGSRGSGTYEDIAELEPDATVLEGLAVNGEQVQGAETEMEDWLTNLGY